MERVDHEAVTNISLRAMPDSVSTRPCAGARQDSTVLRVALQDPGPRGSEFVHELAERLALVVATALVRRVTAAPRGGGRLGLLRDLVCGVDEAGASVQQQGRRRGRHVDLPGRRKPQGQ